MKGRVTISRASDDKVRISMRDETSGIEFAELTLTLENYAYVVTGLSEVEGELETRGLQHVGKRQITERRQVECPLKDYDRKVLSKWLEENAQEDGWLVSTYLGSQSSVEWRTDGSVLHYHVTKYVDAT